jgi:transporter family protein
MDGNIALIAFITLLSWGTGSFIDKLATNRIGMKTVFWTTVVYIPAVILYMLFFVKAKDLITADRLGIVWAIVSGIIGSIGFICFYLLLVRKEASTAVPLTALYPALTAVLAFIFLKETITIPKVTGIVLALVAIYLLSL